MNGDSEVKDKALNSWFWTIWSIVFLASGAGIFICGYLRPGIETERKTLTNRMEVQQKMLALHHGWKDWQIAGYHIQEKQRELEKLDADDPQRKNIESELSNFQNIQYDIRNETFPILVTFLKNNRSVVKEILPEFPNEIWEKPTADYVNLFVKHLNSDRLEESSQDDRKQLDEAENRLTSIQAFFIFCSILIAIDLAVGLSYFPIERWTHEQNQRIKKAEDRFEEAQKKVKNYTWNIANANLEKYYQRNLSESQIIFHVSVTVMVLSFVVILLSLGLGLLQDVGTQSTSSQRSVSISPSGIPTSEAPTTTTPPETTIDLSKTLDDVRKIDRNSVGFIGVIAGIITNFIGATFMIIYRMTNQQAVRYSEALERINDVGMAMDILHSVKESPPSPEVLEAKVTIATKLIDRSRSSATNRKS